MKKLILLELIFLLLATTFPSSNPPGWYQQQLPVNDFVNDIFFLDSLKGWLITTGHTNQNDTAFILHTTNGGDNWVIQFAQPLNLTTIQFLDDNIGYAAGGSGSGTIKMFKTTNLGMNWILIVNGGSSALLEDMFFINKDTGWVSDKNVFNGGLWKTIDGAQSWTQQLNETYKPKFIFFLDKDYGWITTNDANGRIFKTTNGGVNWNLQNSFSHGLNDIHFFNKDTGIVSSGVNYRTTNGGINWAQSNDGGIKLSFANDTVGWAGNNLNTVQKTTNNGITWFRQTTDASVPSVFAISEFNVWAAGNKLMHTTDGGGITNITQMSNEIPSEYKLYQNYPNPFNPVTKIRYSLTKNSRSLRLSVFDIRGKIVKELVNQSQTRGEYEVSFDGSNLPSGIYFYTLTIDNFFDTKKMILNK